jgi:hypothetical protein
MRKIWMIGLFLLSSSWLHAQQTFFSKNTRIRFESKAPLEQIVAVHQTATSVLEIQSGAIQFSVLMAGFNFEKALMQQHFNENYAESSRFPQAIFKGVIQDFDPATLQSEALYAVTVTGTMTVHGVSKPLVAKGSLKKSGDRITVRSTFDLLLPDYNIKNDKLKQISNLIRIDVDATLQPLPKK